ncbi:MAG TPA: hypothetical protein VKT73_15050 [Xanthobacteraceae bacterium]|nr:hypothetical protein [Xanthobacteraceae bacterium]
MDYGDKLMAVMKTIRTKLDASGYGSFVSDKQVEDLAVEILASIGIRE